MNQYTPVLDDQGNVERIIYLALDITNEKKIEEELEKVIAEMTYLKKGVDATLLRAEYLPDGTLLDANALHQKSLGYDIEEFRGKNILVFVPELEREEFMKVWEKVISGELYTVLCTGREKIQGNPFGYLISMFPLGTIKIKLSVLYILLLILPRRKNWRTGCCIYCKVLIALCLEQNICLMDSVGC